MYSFRESRLAAGQRNSSSRVTCFGGAQATLATLWLFALACAFVVALGGMSGVEECLRREASPPAPRACRAAAPRRRPPPAAPTLSL